MSDRKLPAERRMPNMEELLAAALVDRLHMVDGRLVRVVSYEAAKRLTPRQIIALFSPDHYPVRWADRAGVREVGIPYIHHPCNITFLSRAEHAAKTARIDIPQVAKRKRLQKLRGALRRVKHKPAGQRYLRTGKWPSRRLRGKERPS